MKRTIQMALVASALMVAAPLSLRADEEIAAEEHADEHAGHHGEVSLHAILNSTEFWAQIVNFLGLITILVALGRKPLQTFLEARRRTVEDGILEAGKLKAAAEAKHKEYSDRIAQIDAELAKLRSDILNAARVENERIIQDADERAKRLRAETDEVIGQQIQQLQATVSREVVSAAVAAAEKLLRDALKSDDQQRLANDYVAQVASLSQGGRS
jgi:F-type H+-transporting ATPase subunit b